MNKLKIALTALIIVMTGIVSAQNLNTENGGFENRRIINGKKFHVLYAETVINKTIDEVWNEVAGNYIKVGEIAGQINESHCESGNITEGVGASRFCSLDFQGKTVEIKERIIEYRECGNHREFTYDVYETKNFPAKVYNTWIVRIGEDGKTYLGNVFIFRANFAIITGMMENKLKKTGLRGGVLAYKHYLETGEKNVPVEKLFSKYGKY
jgi:hypothetical protein